MSSVWMHRKLRPAIFIICLMMIEGGTCVLWEKCADNTQDYFGLQCAHVKVPLNYDRPGGKQIRLAVKRYRHNSSVTPYKGVVLAKTADMGNTDWGATLLFAQFSTDLQSAYDWVSFDSRGSGESEPVLSCIPDFYPAEPVSLVPSNQQLENHWLNRSKVYAQACRKKYRSVLPHINSLNIARDMEQVRRAIGAEKISIYGSRYGSYIVQLYATMYPNKVEKMILNSPIDSQRIWYQRMLDLSEGFERAEDAWFKWVAKHDSAYHLGNRSCEVKARWTDALKHLEGHAVGGRVGPLEWTSILQHIIQNPRLWFALTSPIAAYINDHDNSTVPYMEMRTDDKGVATALAITCNDRPWPQSWDTMRTTLWRTYAAAPIHTWYQAWFLNPCHFWPARHTETVHVNGSQIGAMLILFETEAPGYRKESVMDIRRRFPGARFVSVTSGTASPTPIYDNGCLRKIANKYMQNGAVPARKTGDVPDAVCPSIPIPDPIEDR